MKKLVLLLAALTSFSLLMAQERFVARIKSPKINDLTEFLKDGYDLAAFSPDKFLDLVITEQQFQELTSKGYRLEITQTEAQLKTNMVAGKA